MERDQRQPRPDQANTSTTMMQRVGSSQSNPASSRNASENPDTNPNTSSNGNVTSAGTNTNSSAPLATDLTNLPSPDLARDNANVEGSQKKAMVGQNDNSMSQTRPQPRDQGNQEYTIGMNNSNSSNSGGRSSLPIPPYAPFPDHNSTGMHNSLGHRQSHYQNGNHGHSHGHSHMSNHHMSGHGSGHSNFYGRGGTNGSNMYMHQPNQGPGQSQGYGHGHGSGGHGQHGHGFGHPPPSHHHHRRHQQQHNPNCPPSPSPYRIDPAPSHAQTWLRQSSHPAHPYRGGEGTIHTTESFSALPPASSGNGNGCGPMNTPAKRSFEYPPSGDNIRTTVVNDDDKMNENGNDISNKNDEKGGKAMVPSNDDTKTPTDATTEVKGSGGLSSYNDGNDASSAVAITIGKDSANPHDSSVNPTMKEELPRRVLQFEPSPKGKSPPTIRTAGEGGGDVNPAPISSDADVHSNRINQNHGNDASSTFDKMTPLDGRHQSRGEHHQPHYDGMQQPHGQKYGARRHGHEQYGQGYGHGQPNHSPYDFYNNRSSSRTSGGQPAPVDYRRDPHPYHPPPPPRGHGSSASGSSAPPPSHDYDRHEHGSDHNVKSGYHSNNRHGRHPATSPQLSGSRYHNPTTYQSQQHQQHSNPPPHQSQKDEYGQNQAMQQFGSLQPSPGLDRMPLMDINSNADSATKFDELMVSPAVGMSGRGRGNKRRTTYDLHDQPIFNDQQHHSSPPSLMRNTSATRYCTPIVTGGNDRSRVAPNGSFSGQSEKNYRPSPPAGDSGGRGGGRYDSDYDSHMRHFHRPYPTIRGGLPSPTRYDDHPPPTQPSSDRYNAPSSGSSPRGMYATPVFPRGGTGPIPSTGGPDPSSTRVPSHNHGTRLPPPSSYYDPHMPYHHNPHPPMYHRDPYVPHGHGSHHPSYTMHGPPHGGQYYSPYDQGHAHLNGHAHHPDYGQIPEKKRRRNDTEKTKKNTKQQRRKKMYSDYVGVTYNKTHAKFQACITHYRKQHYLGRYKLAVDAAKAYDQSAKLLKGDGWKINFQSEKEYELAKDKELRQVEEKRQASGMDSYSLRKSYEATFPTTEMLREKLGLNAKPPAQKSDATAPAPITAPTVPIQQLTSSNANYSAASSHSAAQIARKTSAIAPNNAAAPLQQGAAPFEENNVESKTQGSQIRPTTTSSTTHVDSSQANLPNLNTAVTPSPNVQNLNKGNGLMNEPLMSPGFDSPSANFILGTGTPFSMPDSSLKMGMSSTMKAQRPSGGTPGGLDMVASNIFPSPKPNTPNGGRSSSDDLADESKEKQGKKEPEKEAAASALLMIRN